MVSWRERPSTGCLILGVLLYVIGALTWNVVSLINAAFVLVIGTVMDLLEELHRRGRFAWWGKT